MKFTLLKFTDEPLSDILPTLRRELDTSGEARFLAPNPDLGLGLYAGEHTSVGVHRPLAVWTDLADRLSCHLLTPVARGEFVELHFKRRGSVLRDRGRYGPESEFSRVDKLEDPAFLEDFVEALQRAKLAGAARTLHLGVNTGGELRALELAYPGHAFEVVGGDLDDAALAVARTRFPGAGFVHLDVNALPDDLGRFDLVVALSVLHGSGVNADRVFRALLRDHLAPGGTIVVGLPNCRYEGGEVSYGARMRNFRRPDLSLLLGDAALFRRHLHKHGFRVFVTGKHEVLITGVSSSSSPRPAIR